MWKLKIAEDGPMLRSVNNHVGRQHWEFDPDAGTSEERAQVERFRREFTENRFKRKQSSDLLMRMELRKENPRIEIPGAVKVGENEEITEEAVTITLRRGISFYSSIQAHDGHWASENAGCLFFLPPLVFSLYITGALNTVFSSEHRKEIIRYIYNHQNEDGGWGMNIEGDSSMFATALNYIAMRLLGEGTEDGDNRAMARGREWILNHGSLIAIPSWGKFWMAVLGLYEWSGFNPVLPEIWLLPYIFPLHPGKMLGLCRLVYTPMSYLYGKKYVGQTTEIIHSLRNELYHEPYQCIDWNFARKQVAKEDVFYRHHFLQDLVWEFLQHVAEPVLCRWPFSILREKALKLVIKHVHYEDENSHYISVGCFIKILNIIACWVEDPNSEAFKMHLARIPDYLWVAEDGLKIQGSISQMWDAGFSIQAILTSNLANEYGPTLEKAHDFIKATQVRENPSDEFKEMYRHISKGSWPFVTRDQGWQLSDCTGEGLKAALLLSQMPKELVGEKMEPQRFYDAVNVILSLQSKNGGFPAWEPRRTYSWLEMFNPVEFFEDTLIEREYVECTSSCLRGLVLFKKLYPEHRTKEIESCISKSIQYIKNTQNVDGSWFGRWGICYTYATWLAVEGLAACGINYCNSPMIRKACEFILSKQLPCGGWGESYLSCQNKVYTNLEGNRANLVQTAWALLALIHAGQGEVDPCPIHLGIRVLINAQMEDGDFPQQEITGIFMNNCTLNYSAYRNIFPIWALGKYGQSIIRKARDC